MFSWTAFPESLDNNYDELESTALASPTTTPLPTTSSTSLFSPSQQPAPSSSMLSLPRSASTSQIDATSPTPHFETAAASQSPAPTGPRPHHRMSGAVSLSEAGSLSVVPSPRPQPTPKLGAAHDSASSGLKAPSNSSYDNSPFGVGCRKRQLGLSLDPPSMAWWCNKKSLDLPDFVLISEFSEVEGPRAVMTIPDNIIDLTRDSYSSQKQRTHESSTKHPQEHSDASNSTLTPESNGLTDTDEMFDIHEFVLRITSVDQQASGMFHIPEDIEVHISDTEKGYWAYVHHFTLFDINARGFVRPFCMSYITRDPQKIPANYDDMRRKFSRAALYFKTGNYTLFRQDLTKKLRDLNYTNNLLSEAPAYMSRSHDTSVATASNTTSLPVEVRQDTLTQLTSESLDIPKDMEEQSGGLSEQQKADLESIKDAIETATHIISMLEHYSVDGQPLLGHAEDNHEGPPSVVPLSDLSPRTLQCWLLVGQAQPTLRYSWELLREQDRGFVAKDRPQVFLEQRNRGSWIQQEQICIQHRFPICLEQSRKNSVVSDYDSMMYEAPEYEAQYVTSLYPTYRDEVVFRPLRELCIANMVWNSSIQFHLGIKKIKDILKEFQADSQLLGETADSIKRMYPTCSSMTVGQRFMINFRNPDFNSVTARTTRHDETPVPVVELLQGIPPPDDGLSLQETLLPGAQESPAVATFDEPGMEERRTGPTLDDDADDEQTGYDSLDDAASFFTAATGVAVHADTPTRDAFVIAPLDRSIRVAEWHQEQQTLHRAKDTTNVASTQGASEQVPWSFGAGLTQGDQLQQTGAVNRTQHRQSAQSGTSIGVVATGAIQTSHCPTIILDMLRKDPILAKHLVFALLSGQKVCIMGQSENESKVRALVSVLAAFLPNAGYPTREEQLIEHQRRVVTWYQGNGLLKVEEMEKVYLIGVDSNKIDSKFLESDICILDYDTLTWVNGRRYTDGVILESIFSNMSLFSEDASFMAFVDGRLFDILLKSFLYYHLVFQGRLYQSGMLAHLGAQAYYSSGGASDDGEAFTYQHNFPNSRQFLATFRSSSAPRSSRRDPSIYPSSTNLGTTIIYKGSRPASLYSHESSDAERSLGQGEARRPSKREFLEHARHHHYEKTIQERLVLSGDESGQNGGPMQYTTSQGMHKWRKWLEYWSAKSAAVIDPALAAFGRSDSITALEGRGGGSRRKRNSSRRSSPHRRPRSSPNHNPSPGRQREAKEREKERDRGRDRERDRKTAFDNFEITKEKTISHSSESESCNINKSNSNGDFNYEDMATFEKEVVMDEKGRIEPMDDQNDGKEGADTESKINESHANLAGALAPILKNSGGLRRLKPRRPLLLTRRGSKVNEHDRDNNDGEEAAPSADGDILKRSPSSGSLGSHSSALRNLTDAIRAISLGHPSSSMNGLENGEYSDSHSKNVSRHSSEFQRSPRDSREFSDPSQKDIKKRGSTRAKAKAWLRSKRKRRSRFHEGEQADREPSNENDHDEDLSGEEGQESDDDAQDTEEHQQQTEDSELTIRAVPKSAPVTTLASSTLPIVPPLQSHSSVDPQLPDFPLEAPLTIQEIALLEPTRKRLGSFSGTRPVLNASVAAPGLASLSTEIRSEVDDTEYDPRRDFGRESATEYETSLETFAGMESGNVSSIGREAGRGILGIVNKHSVDSFGKLSLDVAVAAAGAGMGSESSNKTMRQQFDQKEDDSKEVVKNDTTVTLTEEEEAAVRELLGGITGADDWAIIVHLATMVDEYERSKDPATLASGEP
ncbi:Guanine nucleotide exchange protein smcr8 [Entomortierella chlamydospora]|uniref:Guanine nucleotide exchange protein smcr8 n=1 Tax=Entomortierella chlamydospora TaxID=101097 RepID=A0A9P6N4N4_9FUNG|nr:Guanine nucleotide exchange protein smcr8 [Entomortierella chlamydospora]